MLHVIPSLGSRRSALRSHGFATDRLAQLLDPAAFEAFSTPTYVSYDNGGFAGAFTVSGVPLLGARHASAGRL